MSGLGKNGLSGLCLSNLFLNVRLQRLDPEIGQTRRGSCRATSKYAHTLEMTKVGSVGSRRLSPPVLTLGAPPFTQAAWRGAGRAEKAPPVGSLSALYSSRSLGGGPNTPSRTVTKRPRLSCLKAG